MVAWASEQGYRRLRASVRDWNVASRPVLTKLGFRETSEVERDTVHGDRLPTVRTSDQRRASRWASRDWPGPPGR